MSHRPDVFVSATSRDLGSFRAAVAKRLLALDAFPVEQPDFDTDHRPVADVLRDKIAPCRVVIHLAGFYYGAEPLNGPKAADRRSYTQLEVEIAEGLGKPVYVFLANPDCKFDPHDPEPEELRRLQLGHRVRLKNRANRQYHSFSTLDELLKKVDLINFHARPRRRMVVALALVALVFVALAAGAWASRIRDRQDGWEDPAPRRFLTERDVVIAIRNHLTELSPEERSHQRYLILTHAWNRVGLTDGDLQDHRDALVMLLGRACVRPIDSENTVFAVDLRKGVGDRQTWGEMTRDYPYGLTFDRSPDPDVRAAYKSVDEAVELQLPYVRAEWLLASPHSPFNKPHEGRSFATVRRWYAKDLSPDDAARELGLPAGPDLLAKFPNDPSVGNLLGPLRGPGLSTISRRAWEEVVTDSGYSRYQELSGRLGPGAPYKSLP